MNTESCERAIDTRYCATHQRPWLAALGQCDLGPKSVPEFDLDGDEPMPKRWANDMRVKRGLVR